MGRLFRSDAEVGVVLVCVEPVAEAAGGHLWWTRWGASTDVLWLWTMVEGRFDDAYVPRDATEEELRAFDEGRFLHFGQELRVEWLDAEESARVKAATFEA